MSEEDVGGNGRTQPPVGGSDNCEQVLERVYQFIDDELDTASSDAIRTHLVACEPCLERFDVEQAVKALVHKRCGGDQAPSHLRQRVLGRLAVAREQARGA